MRGLAGHSKEFGFSSEHDRKTRKSFQQGKSLSEFYFVEINPVAGWRTDCS